MAEKKCCCRCGAKLFWLVAAALVVVVAVLARSCAKEHRSQQPERPKSVAERVRARIEERVADTNYMANLELVATRYEELGALRAAAAREFAEWQNAFLAANEEARGLAAKAAEARASAAADAADFEARLKALYMADAKGAELIDKLDKLDEAIEANRRIAADYIGARLRRQTDAD